MILIVDDSLFQCQAWRLALSPFDVVGVRTAEELKRFCASKPKAWAGLQAIVLDLIFEDGSDGVALGLEIRSHFPSTPIFISSYTTIAPEDLTKLQPALIIEKHVASARQDIMNHLNLKPTALNHESFSI